MWVHFTVEGPGLRDRLGPLCLGMLQGASNNHLRKLTVDHFKKTYLVLKVANYNLAAKFCNNTLRDNNYKYIDSNEVCCHICTGHLLCNIHKFDSDNLDKCHGKGS